MPTRRPRTRQAANRGRYQPTRRVRRDTGWAASRPPRYVSGRYQRPASDGALWGLTGRLVTAAAVTAGTVFRAHGGTQIPDGARRDQAGLAVLTAAVVLAVLTWSGNP